MLTKRFEFDWVLINELAVGPAPRTERHIKTLIDNGFRGILSLCSENEVSPPPIPSNNIVSRRCVLPDHSYGRDPTDDEITSALQELKYLKSCGPVYVHCKAGIERSPLICIGWLTMEKGLSVQSALDYLMRAHPGTNPLSSHLMMLEKTLVKRGSMQ